MNEVKDIVVHQEKQRDKGLEDYFSVEELDISDYEKKRLKNMQLNYEMMLEVGKPVKLERVIVIDESHKCGAPSVLYVLNIKRNIL